MSELDRLVPHAWRGLVRVPEGLETFLAAERGAIFPPRDQIFAALSHVAPDDVKVVILGQDPYPTAGNANGLAFSVSPGMRVPASLKNVFKALTLDTGVPMPTSGDLTPWAKEGVLLLNTVLTVREGEPASHRKHGWEEVTSAIVHHLGSRPETIVFLAFGAHAQALISSLITTQPVLALPHPSPLNGKAFVVAAETMRPFSRTNELLRSGGRAPIDWTLPHG